MSALAVCVETCSVKPETVVVAETVPTLTSVPAGTVTVTAAVRLRLKEEKKPFTDSTDLSTSPNSFQLLRSL